MHLNLLDPVSLDPRDAILGLWCVARKLKMSFYLTLSLEMSLLSFNHLLHLSFAWHTKRKTGEILRILDRGAAINNTLRVRVLCYSHLGAATLIFLGSSCYLTSSPHLLISLRRLSCLRLRLIGRLHLLFLLSCLHTVRSGCLARF